MSRTSSIAVSIGRPAPRALATLGPCCSARISFEVNYNRLLFFDAYEGWKWFWLKYQPWHRQRKRGEFIVLAVTSLRSFSSSVLLEATGSEGLRNSNSSHALMPTFFKYFDGVKKLMRARLISTDLIWITGFLVGQYVYTCIRTHLLESLTTATRICCVVRMS